MILYVNGTGHTSAALAATNYYQADDDDHLNYLQNLPHPANLRASWGYLLSDVLKCLFHCDATVTKTNREIIDQTRTWINTSYYSEMLVVLQWDKFSNHMANDHTMIWNFHQELTDMKIPHLFFNADRGLATVQDQKDWSGCYIDPYTNAGSYTGQLKSNGFDTVSVDSEYFGRDAHAFWHRFLLKHIVQNNLING